MSEQIKETEVTEREIPCLRVMHGHQAGVYGALLLRDGRLLSYSPDEPLMLWDPLTGLSTGFIPAQEDSIGGVFQIDDDHVITWPEPRDEAEEVDDAGRDGFLPESSKPRYPSVFEPSKIVVWNVNTKERIPLKCECVSPIAGMFQLANGRIHAWSLDGSFTAWYADNPDTVWRCDPLVKRMWDVTLLSDERQLVRSSDTTLRVLGSDEGPFDIVLKGHRDVIRYACELSDKRILSCSDDRTLRVWDSVKGICELVLKGHTDIVIAACELPDGRILSWSHDDTYRVWDAKTGKCLNIIHDKRASKTWRGIKLNCWRIVLWSLMTESWIFNPAEMRIEAVLSGHTGTIRGIVPLGNGNVISFSDDRTLRIWQTGARESGGGGDKSKVETGQEVADGSLPLQDSRLRQGTGVQDGDQGSSQPSGNGQLLQTSGSQAFPVTSFAQRCKTFHRTRRTSGHAHQQQQERRIPMSEENKEANEATQKAQQCFMDYLEAEGFRPDIDKDGDVHFKYEGKHYFILLREKDRQFVRIIHPQFWSIDSEEERQRALAAANITTGRCKCCKVYVSDDNVDAAIELFVDETSHAIAVLNRSLGALQNGVNTFVEEMRKEG
jgi:WD40 repeat protein